MRYFIISLLLIASVNLSSQNQLLVGSELRVGDNIRLTDVISVISKPNSDKEKADEINLTYRVFANLEVKSKTDKEINFMMVIDSLELQEVIEKDSSYYPVNYLKHIPKLNISIFNTSEGSTAQLNNENDLIKMLYYRTAAETKSKYLERIDKTYFTELILELFPYAGGTDLKSKEFLEVQEKIIKNKEVKGKVDSKVDDIRILKRGLVAIEKTSKYYFESFSNDRKSNSTGSVKEVISLDIARGIIASIEQENNYQVITSSGTEKETPINLEEKRTVICAIK